MWPFLLREMRLQARCRSTFFLRMLGATVILSGFAWCWWRLRGADAGSGLSLFGLLARGGIAAAWIVGPVLTADCIARERREQTLGLLWLTPLRPWQVLMAKSVSQWIRALSFLGATVPIYAVPIVLGGVGPADMLRFGLLQMAALGLAMSSGLVASTVFRGWWSTRVAACALNFAFLILFVVGYNGLWTWMNGWQGPVASAPGFATAFQRRFEMWQFLQERAFKAVMAGWMPTFPPSGWNGVWQALLLGSLSFGLTIAVLLIAMRWLHPREDSSESMGWWDHVPPRWRLRFWSVPVVFGATLFLLGALVDWPTVDHVRDAGPWAGRLLAVATVAWTATHLRNVRDPGLIEIMSVVTGGHAEWIRRLISPGRRIFLGYGAGLLGIGWVVSVVAVLAAADDRYPWWLAPSFLGQAIAMGLRVWAGLWLTAYASTRLSRPELAIGLVLLAGYILETSLPAIVHPLSAGWVRHWPEALSEPWIQGRHGKILFGSAALGWGAWVIALVVLARWARDRLLVPADPPADPRVRTETFSASVPTPAPATNRGPTGSP
jgi:hypothetical protein